MDILNILAGLLGMLFMTVVKMNVRKVDAEKLNLVFSYSKYFQKDLLSIILSFLSVFIWQLLFQEAAAKYPQIIGFIRTSFFVMGAIGSFVIQVGLSKTQTWIRTNADVKSDISDNKTTNDLKPV